MGMAGVFSAQADDSSAIWYNPAGLTSNLGTSGDLSIELSSVPVSEPDTTQGQGTTNTRFFDDNKSKIKFIGAYINHVPFLKEYTNLSSGFSLSQPYHLSIFVNENSDATDNTKRFGIIDSAYYQASTMLTNQIDKGFSLGVTADVVWTSIECRDKSISCVENGPVGYGITLGSLYDVEITGAPRVRLGFVWRSPVDLEYSATPDPVSFPISLGRDIQDYLPGRPEQRTLAANMQAQTSGRLININVMAEQVLWSGVAGSKLLLADYNRIGLSSELIFTGNSQWTSAVRAGMSLASPNDSSPDVKVLAVGAGIGFSHHSFIDFAYQLRSTGEFEEEQTSLFSLSYSYQLLQ